MTRALLACRSFFLCFDWIVAVRTPHQGEGDTNGCVVCRNIPGRQARMLRLRRRKEELSLPLYFIYAEMKCCCCSLGVRSGERREREREMQTSSFLYYFLFTGRIFILLLLLSARRKESRERRVCFWCKEIVQIGGRYIAVREEDDWGRNFVAWHNIHFRGDEMEF